LVAIFRDSDRISIAELEARNLAAPHRVVRNPIVIGLLGAENLMVTRRGDMLIARPLRERPATPAVVTYPHEQLLKSLVAAGVDTLTVGPPGTGKSAAARKVMKEVFGEEPVSIPCHGEMLPDDLIGSYQLRGGRTTYVRGPLLRACDRQTGVVLDDADS